MSSLGGGRMASSIVLGIKSEVAKAMDDAKKEIGVATAELVSEIRDGSKAVKAAIKQEAANVRAEFGDIVGNAAAVAEQAVVEVKQEAARIVPLSPTPNPQPPNQAGNTIAGSAQHDFLKKTSSG